MENDNQENKKYPVGIYFNISDEEYHNIPALSASGIKQILVSPAMFWAQSWMNPKKKQVTTKSMDLGNLCHDRVLFGKKYFYDNYFEDFDDNDYPDALRTADDIKVYLENNGLKKSGKKQDLIERVLDHDPSVDIIDTMRESFYQKNSGKKPLSANEIEQVELCAAMIEMNKDLSKAFQNGYPEVAVVWLDKKYGCLMKAKIDYLKTKAIIDLKTFSNPHGRNIDKAIYQTMANSKYHIQACNYYNAMQEAIKFAKKGMVYGNVDKKWLESFASHEEKSFMFVFFQTFGQHGVFCPLAEGWKFNKHNIYKTGLQQIDDAKHLFVKYNENYGNERWIHNAPLKEFHDDEFPIYTTEL